MPLEPLGRLLPRLDTSLSPRRGLRRRLEGNAVNLDTLRAAIKAADDLSAALDAIGTSPGTSPEEILAQAEINTDDTRANLRALMAREEGARLERVTRLP